MREIGINQGEIFNGENLTKILLIEFPKIRELCSMAEKRFFLNMSIARNVYYCRYLILLHPTELHT